MLRLLLPLLLLLFLCTGGRAQSPLIPYLKGDVYGFADTTGKIIVEPRFTWVETFRDNVAIVEDGEQKALIRRDGSYLLSPRVTKITGYYRDGHYRFTKGDKIGIINLETGVVVKPRYTEIRSVMEGVYIVTDGQRYGILNGPDEGWKLRFPLEYDKIELDRENRFHFTRGTTEEVYSPFFRLIETKEIKPVDAQEEIAVMEDIAMDGDYFSGSAGRSGARKLPYFDTIYADGKMGLVLFRKDTRLSSFGEILRSEIPAIYDDVNPRHEWSNFIAVKKDGKWGGITKDNQPYLEFEYDSIDVTLTRFQNFHFKPYKQYFTVMKDGKWGVVGNTAKFQTPPASTMASK